MRRRRGGARRQHCTLRWRRALPCSRAVPAPHTRRDTATAAALSRLALVPCARSVVGRCRRRRVPQG
eukprot:5900450-Prymnesium_polylepis.1